MKGVAGLLAQVPKWSAASCVTLEEVSPPACIGTKERGEVLASFRLAIVLSYGGWIVLGLLVASVGEAQRPEGPSLRPCARAGPR